MKISKLVSYIFVLGVFILGINPAFAQTGSMMDDSTSGEGILSIEAVLQEILAKQNVATVQDLNYQSIGDAEWERLGDAVMEKQHPGEVHEVMDRMMGGEGSESLRRVHINMGKAYLGYGASRGPGMMGGYGMMGMMSYGGDQLPNGNYQKWQYPMMGFGGNSFSGYGLLSVVFLVSMVVFFIAGAYFFIKKAGKSQ